MTLNRLIRSAIGSFPCNLSFEILEGWSNLIAFHLFFIEFVLKLKRHSIVSVLSLLKLNSCLMDLSQNIEIFVLVHGGLSCFIEKNVIFLPQFFDFALEHSIRIYKCIISIFSLIDSHLKLFLNLLVRSHLFLQPCILSLSFFLLLIILILLILWILLVLVLIFIVFNHIKLMLWSLIMQRLQNHIRHLWLVLFSFD